MTPNTYKLSGDKLVPYMEKPELSPDATPQDWQGYNRKMIDYETTLPTKP